MGGDRRGDGRGRRDEVMTNCEADGIDGQSNSVAQQRDARRKRLHTSRQSQSHADRLRAGVREQRKIKGEERRRKEEKERRKGEEGEERGEGGGGGEGGEKEEEEEGEGEREGRKRTTRRSPSQRQVEEQWRGVQSRGTETQPAQAAQ